ncbi:DUF6624 domain-containing protein [Pontimicrobium aquaticum]|uniref:Lipoprotein n=1 Tax=Pontimicrobium aquaticum TaxID=2565367 RepID=A0A4U0F197_9FLAO|nr:DUF6624 domain-containing protein [Pontimicrobium aquaticum]TJY38153.1 hypothetical protein E5167_02545 [Pontimicrobium aquaticum]
MKLKTYTFSLLIIFLISCNNENKYIPNGLTKLTEKELIDRARNKEILDIQNITYKNENGEILTLDSIKKIPNQENWAYDRYVDKNGIVREMILRKATQKDGELLIKLQQAYNYVPIKIINIDCQKKAEILEEIHSLDQNMRLTDNLSDIDPKIDKQNLIKVVSLIENCGMPTKKDVTKKQMNAIWLVFQHADNINRKKYFPLLKKSAEMGDLDKSSIALMEDRILMFDGKPQVYGSQITQNRETKKWELYNLEKPEFVDRRRAKVGLGSLKEYLKNWNIEFNVEQFK